MTTLRWFVMYSPQKQTGLESPEKPQQTGPPDCIPSKASSVFAFNIGCNFLISSLYLSLFVYQHIL